MNLSQNADVLQYATIPNVHLNNGAQQMSKCKFFSGDWESFAELCQFTCDLVLTSETIYNPANYHKLHNTIKKVLKPTGIAYPFQTFRTFLMFYRMPNVSFTIYIVLNNIKYTALKIAKVKFSDFCKTCDR